MIPLNQTYVGDWIDTMRQWPDEFVQTVVTSPPYWGLRDYQEDGQLGLEKTPEEYLEKMVAGFRQIRRILRKDGTVFLNMGDSYAANRTYQVTDNKHIDVGNTMGMSVPLNLKPKDKCGIPERLVLALQADGWWWRQTIIFAKKNPMPESVNGWRWERHRIKTEQKIKSPVPSGWNVNHDEPDDKGRYSNNQWQYQWQDCPGCPKCEPNDGLILSRGSGRPTTAHEYIYLLTKSDRYFYDTEAVREGNQVYTRKAGGYKAHKDQMIDGYEPFRGKGGFADSDVTTVGRNLRSVWTMATQACSFAHFATFPEELANNCILAGTSLTACGTCGAPYAPVVEKNTTYESYWAQSGKTVKDVRDVGKYGGRDKTGKYDRKRKDYDIRLGPVVHSKILSYRRTCQHDDPTGRCVVYDPFSGTNTVGYRAQELGRDWIGIELSDKYAAYGERRTAQQVMGI